MTVKIKVAGVFSGQPLNRTFEEPLAKGDTLKRVLGRLDKKHVLGRKFFAKLLKQGSATLLLNGDRMEPPDALDYSLNEGDEISILSTIAGGKSPSC
ncbi:MAG: MoaD/ThiS family protein [Candidatus Abyssobacteria bacterium SURF_17]|uniref:MoaD/ThiS family protein n=1 Tax=Candidatus Abyssobacteria bacterium SURF_17 TaxID=2093361 RepID=A0A419ESW6_9BACT|nr:MAG: MoaD/ThiS family protein [Candidatus Abyssubacteria bacterium SURF_17]